MTQVSDNFSRANGPLGGNWGPAIPNNNEFGSNTSVGGGLLINGNGYGPANASGGDCAALWNGRQTFLNDQWALAVVNSVASPTATLNITAATQSGGNTTYTYTVATGSVVSPVSGGALYVIVTGMQNAGNNGHFVATTFGSGTFTVANASGVTETGSSGSGNCPSDSGAGVMVRGNGSSASSLNGYYFHIGTNSFSGDGRVAYYELWKIVNGAGTLLAGPSGSVRVASQNVQVGDWILLTVIGTTVKAYINGSQQYSVTDSAISSGVPGITSFTVNGPTEYVFADWATPGQSFTGNNGTTLKNFVAGDFADNFIENPLASDSMLEGVVATPLQTDSFTYANGDLHTANANWAYQGISTFQVSADQVFSSHAGVNLAYRSDASPTNDQYSEVKAVVTGAAATQNTGPAVRVSASAVTCYAVQFANNTFTIIKELAGTLTTLATVASGFPVTGDVIRLQVVGNYLTVFKNGTAVTGLTNILDGSSPITSGNVGIFGAGSATTNGFSSWNGGNINALPSQFTQQSGLWYSDPVSGAYTAALVSNNSEAYQNTVSWPNDQYAQATMSGASIASIQTIGPAVRVSNSAVTFYMFTPHGNDGTAIIEKVVNGASGVTLASASYTFTQGDVFRLEVVGPHLIGRVNGTVLIDAFDIAIVSGNAGLIAQNVVGNPATPSGTLKNWSAGGIVIPALGVGDMKFDFGYGF